MSVEYYIVECTVDNHPTHVERVIMDKHTLNSAKANRNFTIKSVKCLTFEERGTLQSADELIQAYEEKLQLLKQHRQGIAELILTNKVERREKV